MIDRCLRLSESSIAETSSALTIGHRLTILQRGIAQFRAPVHTSGLLKRPERISSGLRKFSYRGRSLKEGFSEIFGFESWLAIAFVASVTSSDGNFGPNSG